MLKADWFKFIGKTAILSSVLMVLNTQAQPLIAEQCFESPARDSPCTNLIYSSFNNNGVNTQFCLCKTDRTHLLTLLEQGESTTEMKQIRQLVSQHRLTQPELISLLRSVN
jgi:hypothetical protein